MSVAPSVISALLHPFSHADQAKKSHFELEGAFASLLHEAPRSSGDPSNASNDFIRSFAADGAAGVTSPSPRDRAFGFAQLGMFGLHAYKMDANTKGATAGSENPVGSTHPAADETMTGSLQSANTNAIVFASAGAGALNDSGAADLAVPAKIISSYSDLHPSADAASSQLPASQELGSLDVSPELDGLKEKIVPDKPVVESQTLPHLDTNSVDLVVSGEGEQLTVSARMQEPVIADTMRGLLETAAEFDMQIGEMRINGSLVSLPQQISGGSRGSRSR